MGKSILSTLEKNDFDILLLDFVDERFNLFEFENTICALSNEAVATGIKEKYPNHKIIARDSQKFFKMWEEGWHNFIELMVAKDNMNKVILNKVYWAEETISGDTFKPVYPKNKIKEMNKFLNRLYKIAEQSILPKNIIHFSDKILLGADKHKWGRSPFHYIPEYYKSALNFLNNWKRDLP
jgi:hypothetical protein